MSSLKSRCEKLIAARKSATQGEWTTYGDVQTLAGSCSWVKPIQDTKDDVPLLDSDTQFITLAANEVKRLAQDALKLQKVVKDLVQEFGLDVPPTDGAEPAACKRARQILAEVDGDK